MAAAAKKKEGASVGASVIPLKPSLMKAGTGSTRVDTRLIVLYGAPKARKTTSASFLTGSKWVISDPNAIPTLDAPLAAEFQLLDERLHAVWTLHERAFPGQDETSLRTAASALASAADFINGERPTCLYANS